jgi:lipoic acid synthetase
MNPISKQASPLPKPAWLRRSIPSGAAFRGLQDMLGSKGLHTVCQEALCPNLGECFSHGTAAFLILGDRCTRNCRFCAVAHGPLSPPDPEEPSRVAEAVDRLGLSYAVVTSVTRDDLADGGASQFAETIGEIRIRMPRTKVEVLIPDFQGDEKALRTVIDASPHVLNHNIETVPGLYPTVRPQAVYERSIRLLHTARTLAPTLPTKSGIMLGLGESYGEVLQTLRDILNAGCRIVTIGQYLQPSTDHLPVYRYVPPEEFEALRHTALQMGFAHASCGPLVRSSYHAQDFFPA